MKTTKEKFKDEITIINKCCGKISFCNLTEHNKKVINATIEVIRKKLHLRKGGCHTIKCQTCDDLDQLKRGDEN